MPPQRKFLDLPLIMVDGHVAIYVHGECNIDCPGMLQQRHKSGQQARPSASFIENTIRLVVLIQYQLVAGNERVPIQLQSAGSLGWPFPTLKCKHISEIKYTETILSNCTRKLLRFDISKILIAVLKNLLCYLL